MKAAICPKYGTPDVLKVQDVDMPVPKANEIRIRVHAASLGPSDCSFRKGDPFIIKLMYGLRKPRYPIMGAELSGEVESVGNEVKQYKAGDPIFGLSVKKFGAHAEYLTLPEDAELAIKPDNMTYEDAVAVCDGATTALTFLRDKAKVQSGQKVLVNGASGAVGSYAVQLAKYYGAEVTAVCSTANIEMVRSLGADHVVDYAKEDFTKSGQTYDVIFDAVGKSSFSRCKGSLTAKGKYLSTVPALSVILQMLWTSIAGSGRKAIFAAAGLMQTKENLIYLRDLYEAGKLKPVIDRRYPLEQIAEAHRYVDLGRKKGNVIITLQHLL